MRKLYVFSLPLLIGFLVGLFPGNMKHDSVFRWMPEWTGVAALWGCAIWFLVPGGVFTAPKKHHAPLPAHVKPFLANILLSGTLVWLLWGQADILPICLLCAILSLSSLLPGMLERHSGITVFVPRKDAPLPASKPLDGPFMLKLAAWWACYLLSVTCSLLSCCLVYEFAIRHGATPDVIDPKLDGHSGMLWLLTLNSVMSLGVTAWFTIAVNFPEAPRGRRVAAFCLLEAPVLGAVGLIAVVWLPRPIPPWVFGGLFGAAVGILVTYRTSARKQLAGRYSSRPG